MIQESSFTELGQAILKALAYSDIFNYPLNADEIKRDLEIACPSHPLFEEELQILIDQGVVFQFGEFYAIQNNPDLLDKRLDRNQRAQTYLKHAFKISKFIGNFPFVRGVFLSGSISKNSMDQDSDIDYFIITEPGRLWLTRSLLIFFKKIFLFNSYKLFCLNYFIDSDHLLIEDRDLYIAHEVESLVPTYGQAYCNTFFKKNQWALEFLPNATFKDTQNIPANKLSGLKWFFEKLLGSGFGKMLNGLSKNLFKKYWQYKFKHQFGADFSDVVSIEDHRSTHHPSDFRKVVAHEYQSRLAHLEAICELEFKRA